MNRPAPGFTGAVLTGGASARMGTDKALLEVDGVALARRVADALRAAGADEVVAIGGDHAALAALGLATLADEHPGTGPLAAVATALDHAERDVTVVLACDLPAVTPELVLRLVEARDAGEHDAAVASVDDVPQVLIAAYHRRCAPVLAAAFAAGERSLRRVLPRLDVALVTDVEAQAVTDLDSPEDVRRYAAREPEPADGTIDEDSDGSSGGRT